ncbi:heavy-metal-associated domain-containing protein, partial [Paenibacillus sepulcri]|nr:heavy-metal-associated domain-containing protein [Paenibacillus sepulcri]
MKEYRVKGLSCGNCALAIENQLKRLEYGETAELHYNTGKLKLDPRISFAAVESILKADHAYIERGQESHHGHEDHAHSHGEHDHQHEHGDGHSHSHSHSHGHGLLGP